MTREKFISNIKASVLMQNDTSFFIAFKTNRNGLYLKS